MNILLGDDFLEVRVEPLSKKNRARIYFEDNHIGQSGDIKEFRDLVWEKRESLFHGKLLERRENIKTSLHLEHIFWRVRNDPYVGK